MSRPLVLSTSGASSNNATPLCFGFLPFPLRCYSLYERSPAWLVEWRVLSVLPVLFCHPLRLASVLPCFPFSFFFSCFSYVCIHHFSASFSVTRVSHDEAKLSRERASAPLWVASKAIGRGEGSGRRENAADKAGRRWQTGQQGTRPTT